VKQRETIEDILLGGVTSQYNQSRKRIDEVSQEELSGDFPGSRFL